MTKFTETLDNNTRIKKKLVDVIHSEIKETKVFNIAKDDTDNVVGVYRMLYNNEVMYIGYSKRLGNRLKEHWNSSHVPEILKNKEKITVNIIACYDKYEAKILESTLIRFHNTVRYGWNKKR